jgi:hypothetical protein
MSAKIGNLKGIGFKSLTLPLKNVGAVRVAMVAAQSVVFGKMAIFCYSPALYTKLISSIICGFSDHYDHYEKKSVTFISRALAYFI